ncbi:AAA family ATPase [Vibrio parahaemolyticus]|nr:AAA family ATPase [Vibrio parahaemolyticus]EKL9958201.1 AAA family ATPase [Vibrio parahaemolyticus]
MNQLYLNFGREFEAIKNNLETFQYTYGSVGYEQKSDWLVKGLIPTNSTVALVGASGDGKSFAIQELACCVCTGQNFLGNKTNVGSALIIAGEGASGFKKRIKGWELANNKNVKNLAVLPHGVFATEEEQSSTLEKTLTQIEFETGLPVALIVIDTLNRSFQGDENTPSDMSKFIQSWDKIRLKFPSASIVFVHHTGKDTAKGARGHSSFKGAMDVELMVKKGSNPPSYILSNTKQKDAEEAKSILVKLSQIELGITCDEGFPITTLSRIEPAEIVSEKNKNDKSCPYLNCIKQLGSGCTRRELREYIRKELHPEFTPAERTKLSKALSKLIANGNIALSKDVFKSDDDKFTLLMD